MGVKVSNQLEFDAIVYDGVRLFPNHFNVKINMKTTTENGHLQNVAIQRIHFFLHDLLNEAIFIQANSPLLGNFIEMLSDNFVVTFPDEPYEHVVGMVIYDKILSILEGNFDLIDVVISSSASNDIFFTINEKETFLPKDSKHIPWWLRSDMSTNDLFPIKDIPSWQEVDLGWEQTDNVEEKKFPDVTIISGNDAKN